MSRRSDAEWPLKFSCRYSNHSSRPRKLARAPALASHRSTDSQSSPGAAWQVESTAGVGTQVHLYLPRFQGAMPPASRRFLERASANVKGTERILVVEDESEVRAVSVAVLRDMGYQVLEAPRRTLGDGYHAKSSEAHRHVVYRCGFTSGMNGAVLAAQALAIRPKLRVLFTTGYARNALTSRPARLGGRVDCEALHVPGIRCARARGVRSAIHLVGSLGFDDRLKGTSLLDRRDELW